jgi:hypothetical protein
MTIVFRYELHDEGRRLRGAEQLRGAGREMDNVWIFDRARRRRGRYSDLSATVGSTLVARTAGMNEASRDAANRISGAATRTTGSTLLTP